MENLKARSIEKWAVTIRVLSILGGIAMFIAFCGVAEYMGGLAFVGCVSSIVGIFMGFLLATLIEGFACIVEYNYQMLKEQKALREITFRISKQNEVAAGDVARYAPHYESKE